MEVSRLEYVYPATFKSNKDGSYTILFPDLPGCISEGKSLANAMYMAQSGLKQWIEYLNDKKIPIQKASAIEDIHTETDEFKCYIYADVKDGRAVKRTVSIPKELDEKSIELGLSLSRVLQDALSEKIAALS